MSKAQTTTVTLKDVDGQQFRLYLDKTWSVNTGLLEHEHRKVRLGDAAGPVLGELTRRDSARTGHVRWHGKTEDGRNHYASTRGMVLWDMLQAHRDAGGSLEPVEPATGLTTTSTRMVTRHDGTKVQVRLDRVEGKRERWAVSLDRADAQQLGELFRHQGEGKDRRVRWSGLRPDGLMFYDSTRDGVVRELLEYAERPEVGPEDGQDLSGWGADAASLPDIPAAREATKRLRQVTPEPADPLGETLEQCLATPTPVVLVDIDGSRHELHQAADGLDLLDDLHDANVRLAVTVANRWYATAIAPLDDALAEQAKHLGMTADELRAEAERLDMTVGALPGDVRPTVGTEADPWTGPVPVVSAAEYKARVAEDPPTDEQVRELATRPMFTYTPPMETADTRRRDELVRKLQDLAALGRARVAQDGGRLLRNVGYVGNGDAYRQVDVELTVEDVEDLVHMLGGAL